MLKNLIYFIFATLLGCISAHAVDGSNIRIMVLQDDMDADINCVRSDNAVCLRRFNADHLCRLKLDQGLLLD